LNDPGTGEVWDGIEVYCDCSHLFRVKRSLKGGLTNCPNCRRAVPVPGGPEPLFFLLLGAGGLLFGGVAALCFVKGAALAGFIVLGVGLLALVAFLVFG
jgi:hypothetical protein